MSVSDALEWLKSSRASLQVKPTILPASYFKFPPAPEPITVPPPVGGHTLSHPFTIPADIYNALLSPHVPITIALVYMSVVSLLNSVNANRKYKPWAFSRTRIFKLLVILHNVFLAVYSTWTFVGMFNALRLVLPELNEHWSTAKTADALCKLHGPRGVGSAATYNATTNSWTMTNRLFHLAADGLTPETTDVGRIWNEGLAFYGWIFYLSKFYEVIDTLIILAKGKKSSLLQTYHHAGAMLCMWAGIRYMSPPIWMFVFVNSGIHAVMYTFYLCSALKIRVPKWFKRSLTTLQITQFVVGATYAFAHLFVAYQIPVSVPYLYRLGEAISSAVSSAPSDLSSAGSSAIATASAGTGAWLKKAVLRGAGFEGLAENVLNEQGKPFGIDAVHIVENLVAREETRYRDELQWVNCLDTSGQVFAILLNVVYLAPLTWLFVQFFIQSYLKAFERRRSSTAGEAAQAARQSFNDASWKVARRLSEAVEEMHRTSEEIGDDDVLVDGDEIKKELREAALQAKLSIKRGAEKLKQAAPNVDSAKVKAEVQRDMEAVRKNLQDTAEKVKEKAGNALNEDQKEAIKTKAQSAKDTTTAAVEKAIDNVKSVAETVQQQAGPTVSAGKKKAKKAKDNAVETAQKTAEQAKDTAAKATDSTQDAAQKAKQEANEPETKPTDGDSSIPEERKPEDQPQTPSPNGNGTGADEATDQELKTEKTEDEPPQSAKAEEEKKEQDQIIDESQIVREEDVDTTTGEEGKADGKSPKKQNGKNGNGDGDGERWGI